MAVAEFAAEMKSLTEGVFGEPVYFTEPRQISGTTQHQRITPPYTVISGPTDAYRPDAPTIDRSFNIRHVVTRGEGRALEAYGLVESFVALVEARGAGIYVDGGGPLEIESIEAPELEGADNLFVLEVTLNQERER